MLLYPILLIAVVGFGLSISAENKMTVALYGDDPIFDSLRSDPSIEIIEAGDKEQLVHLVSSKRAVLGITSEIIEDRKTINVYNDPTKTAVVSNLLLLVEKAANEEKLKSGESLSALQRRLVPKIQALKEKRAELDSLLLDIDDAKDNITTAKAELQEAKTRLRNHRSDLENYNSSLDSIDDYAAKLSEYESRLNGLYSQTNLAESRRNQASSRISQSISKIDSYTLKVNTALGYVNNIKSYSLPSDVLYYVNAIQSDLLSMKTDLSNARADLTAAQTELSLINFVSIKTEISSVKGEVSATKAALRSFKSDASSELESLIEETNEVDARLTKAISDFEDLEVKLDEFDYKARETRDLIDQMLIPLEEFAGKKPEELLPPEIISTSVFGEQKSINLFFPSVIGIDMILASLLLPMIMRVRMMDQGIELRLLQSKASTYSVVLGATLANYVLALLQLVLISLTAIIFFDVGIRNPLGFLLVLITVPMVFTSLGILLAQLVNRSSTAFLLSLLVSIPMIFISGTIIPMEFLNPLIRSLGSTMPLYVVIDFSEKLMFRDVVLMDIMLDYVYLILFISFNLFLALLVYRLRR